VVLTALGETPSGQAGVIYKWSTVRLPAGARAPNFSTNDNNSAQQVAVTFHKDGSYIFRCTISDDRGDALASDVSVDVIQRPTSVRAAPSQSVIDTGHSVTINATEYDQFGDPLQHQPYFDYEVTAGPGNIPPYSITYSSSMPGQATIVVSDDNDNLESTTHVLVVAATR
jgi:hypothetical protein